MLAFEQVAVASAREAPDPVKPDVDWGYCSVCCEVIFEDKSVYRQIEHLRDNQVTVVLSDSSGHKCRFGLVAIFYPTNEKREVILRCQECGRRWMIVLDHGEFRVAEA